MKAVAVPRAGSLTSTIAVFCFIVLVVGADSCFAIDIAGIAEGVRKLNNTLFKTMKIVVTLVLFIIALWQLVEGYMNHQLQSKWLSLIGIAVFIAVLNTFQTIFELVIPADLKSQMGTGSGGIFLSD